LKLRGGRFRAARQEIELAKGQKKSSREAKKPKQDKKKVEVTASPFANATGSKTAGAPKGRK